MPQVSDVVVRNLPSLAKPKRMPLSCADLFAGAGGLSVGFETAGFRPAFFNEYDEIASATYAANSHRACAFVEPIQGLDLKTIKAQCDLRNGDLDILLGGPPCQGFSINAPIRSDKDPRNHLFRHYIRLLEGLEPKFILMENVPGLVSLDGGRTLSDVVTAFEGVGYRVIFKVLNAAQYGVPQERWRLFFLGTNLRNVELSFPDPICYCLRRPNFTGGREFTFLHAVGHRQQESLFGGSLLPPTTVREAIDDLPVVESGNNCETTEYPRAPDSEYQEIMRKGSREVLNHQCMGLAKVNLERMKYVKAGGSWRDIPFELLPKGLKRARRSDHTRRYGRLDPDSQSGTVLTKCDPHWGTFVHYGQDRVITIREAARIQSFPDWFHFVGSRVSQYRQVGNAVPPLVARFLADHVKGLMKKAQRRAVARRKK